MTWKFPVGTVLVAPRRYLVRVREQRTDKDGKRFYMLLDSGVRPVAVSADVVEEKYRRPYAPTTR